MVKTQCFYCWGQGSSSIPVLGTKIPQATLQGPKKKKKEKKNILLNILLSFLETRTRPGVFTCRQCCQTPGPQRRAGRRNGTLTPKHQREPDGAGRCAGGGGTAAPSRGRRAPAHTLPDHRLLPSLSNPTWSKDMTQNVRKVLPLPQK